jgi:hypothetical protein
VRLAGNACRLANNATDDAVAIVLRKKYAITKPISLGVQFFGYEYA